MNSKISRRRFLGGMGLVLSGIGLQACTPAAPPAPVASPKAAAESTAAPKAAQTAVPKPTYETVKWRHATVVPQFNTAFQHMSFEKGFWREYGIDIELINLQNDANITRALLANEIDSAEPGAAAGIVAAVKSSGAIKLLGSFQHGLPIAMFAKSDIRKVEDLVGKRVGVSAIGALPHNLTLGLLDKYGVDPSKVQFIALQQAGGTLIQGLLADKIDAGVSSIEFQQVIATNPDIKILALFSKELPQYIRLGWFATAKNIQERPEVIKRVLYGETKGVRYAMANRGETVELAAKLTKGDKAAMEFVFDQYVQNKDWLDLDFQLSAAAVNYMQDFNIRVRSQDQKVPAEQIMLAEFQEAVVKGLGRA